jgi:hypothetical protein
MAEVRKKNGGKEDEQEGVKVGRTVSRWTGRRAGRQEGGHTVRKLVS